MIIKTGKIVITNDMANYPRSKGLPAGHPIIQSFLGVPIFQKSKLIGSFGLANRPGGYDFELVKGWFRSFGIHNSLKEKQGK